MITIGGGCKMKNNNLNYTYENYEEDLKIANFVFIKHFLRYQAMKDDLLQVAMVDLWKGRDCYDKSKGKYSTYACKICFNAMLIYIHKEFNNCADVISVNIQLKTTSNNLTLNECLEDTAYRIEDVEDIIVIRQVLKRYFKTLKKDSKEYKICKLVLKGNTTKEICSILQCSHQYVDKIKNQFRIQLKNMLKKEML